MFTPENSLSTVVQLKFPDRVVSEDWADNDFCHQAYTAGGSFAEYAVTPVAKTAKLPEHVSTKEAATAILQGLTGESRLSRFVRLVSLIQTVV